RRWRRDAATAGASGSRRDRAGRPPGYFGTLRARSGGPRDTRRPRASEAEVPRRRQPPRAGGARGVVGVHGGLYQRLRRHGNIPHSATRSGDFSAALVARKIAAPPPIVSASHVASRTRPPPAPARAS